MKLKQFTLDGILEMDKRYRTQFVNSLSGFKSVNLCGTVNEEGITNLSVISSVVHVGAHPPLMGMIIRPDSVPRHTLSNLLSNGCYTLNHIDETFYKRAHQAAARYPEEVSEFEAAGLEEWYSEDFPAPYVAGAKIKIGLECKERIDITSNGTIFIVGKIREVFLPEDCVEADGFVDPAKAGSLTVASLDGYYKASRIARLFYAKPDRKIEEIG